MGIFLASLFGRFVATIALTWLGLFILLYLLPGAGGEPLALQLSGDRLAVTLPLVLLAAMVALPLGAGISLLAGARGWLA
jgi:hypothetical protein